MIRDEFENEFKRIKDAYENLYQNGSLRENWHTFVLRNLRYLSDEALYHIVENAGNPFGEWMVKKAVDLTVFEDIVLK